MATLEESVTPWGAANTTVSRFLWGIEDDFLLNQLAQLQIYDTDTVDCNTQICSCASWFNKKSSSIPHKNLLTVLLAAPQGVTLSSIVAMVSSDSTAPELIPWPAPGETLPNILWLSNFIPRVSEPDVPMFRGYIPWNFWHAGGYKNWGEQR